MNIKLELLKNYITDFINNNIQNIDIDVNKIANSKAISILSDVQQIIKNNSYTDFEVVEEIVSLFERNGISCGARHDF